MREAAQVNQLKGSEPMKNVETAITEKTAAGAPQGAHAAPEKASSNKATTRKNGAPQAPKTAKGRKPSAEVRKKAAKAAKPTAKKASAPRAESKGAKIIEMIRRAKERLSPKS
jgi:hypothetical protein